MALKNTNKPQKPRIPHHVCIPLYRGIPKEVQTGWIDMGPHQVAEWDNTTNLLPYLMMNPNFDKTLYCGTCGRIMVKGRNRTIDKSGIAKRVELTNNRKTIVEQPKTPTILVAK